MASHFPISAFSSPSADRRMVEEHLCLHAGKKGHAALYSNVGSVGFSLTSSYNLNAHSRNRLASLEKNEAKKGYQGIGKCSI